MVLEINPIPSSLRGPSPAQGQPSAEEQVANILANADKIPNLSTEDIQALLKMLQNLTKESSKNLQQAANQENQAPQVESQDQLPPKMLPEVNKLMTALAKTLEEKTKPESKPLAKNLEQGAALLAQGGRSTNLSAALTSTLLLPTLVKAVNILQQQGLPPAAAHALLQMLQDPAQAAQVARLLQNPQAMALLLQSFSPQLPQLSQALMQTLNHLSQNPNLPSDLQNLAKLANQLTQGGQNLAQLASSQPQVLTALLTTLTQNLQSQAGQGIDQSLLLFSQAVFSTLAQAHPPLLANEAMLQTLAALLALQNRRQEDKTIRQDKKRRRYLDGEDVDALEGPSEEEEEESEKDPSKRKRRSKQSSALDKETA